MFSVRNCLWILGFFLPLEDVLKDGFMVLILFSFRICLAHVIPLLATTASTYGA